MAGRLLTGLGIAAVILLIAVSAVLILRYSNSTYRNFKAQTGRLYSGRPHTEHELITEADLAGLPDPVRKYLDYVGIVGTEKVHHYSVGIEGEFRMNEERGWAPVKVEQISFAEKPARLFFMEMKFMGMKIFGLHHYEDASASMVIKIMDLFTVADAKGPEMNKGETVTVFNDMCILVPSTLIDPRISWRLIDDLTVEGAFTNEGITVRGTLFFNEEGQLINFISDDRYYWNEDNTYEQIRWATPLGNYREINGLKLATYGEAVWMKKEGDFSYAKFHMQDISINPGID